jgi:hypothetical protein
VSLRSRPTASEVLFLVLLYGVAFFFYAYDRRNPLPQEHDLVFFLSYTGAALFTSYYLLPRYVYRRRYLGFAVWVLALVAGLMLLEELVIEPIYFPDDRALRFPGLIISLLHILPVLTILIGGKFGWDAVRSRGEVQELRAAVRESELSMLQSQINPHFLFNNLNNLYSYALEGSPKTPEIILELSGVLRYMIYDCRARYVPLRTELSQLRNFVQLYELQIEERGSVTLALPEDYPGDLRIAPLILPVFVENAFKHGQAGLSSNIDIAIAVRLRSDGVLDFRCANRYAPAPPPPEKSGLGLTNVRKRLNLLYPGPAHDLRIEDRGDAYRVLLTLDLQNPLPE